MIASLALALLQATLPASACPDSDGVAMSYALGCMALIPAPNLPLARGVIDLRPVHTPFGVAVTVDGRPRQHMRATITGLPDPRSLGPYHAYVAWAYTLSIDSGVKLGPVTNGRMELGELDRLQFRILISAERSAAVSRRSGVLVLRGTSPSARLLAHRDFLRPLGGTTAFDSARGTAAGMAAMHGSSMGAVAEARPGAANDRPRIWSMPPMPDWMPVMPGMAGLVPSVAPFLPARAVRGAVFPALQARLNVHLEDGDTLALEAGLVRRTVAGRTFTAYAFNGQLPGPLIDVKQGAAIVVRFRNSIDQPSSVHWHGVRLDSHSDGTVGITQRPVLPGESYTYTVHFPDAGIYWYHPHVREDIQQNLGLYGNLVVRSASPGYYNPVNREEFLALDDLLLGTDGPAAYGDSDPVHTLMGRWGNVLLVNGEPRRPLSVNRGEIVRFYLTNVSSARIYNVSFGGMRIKAVGSDAGKFEREEWVRSVVIAPAERYIVEVAFPRTGTVALVNRVQALDHMIGSYAQETDTLAIIHVGLKPATPSYAEAFNTLRRNADVAADLAPLRKYFDKPVDRELVLTIRTQALRPQVSAMLLGINAAVEWNDGMPMANWVTTGREARWVIRDPASGKENMEVDWRFRAGEMVKVRLFNDPASSHAMNHPIHLHGQRFLVLSRDGVSNENLVWKDTAIIAASETVDLLVDMSNPGRWMLHCHIAEHLSGGMMTTFTVEPP
ncbi:MAG TPA: multicopper oxidase family protein [Gemmatimonadaceae bacterium]|nr:multicopper oxidase family protein [Gemmatimonadaceae bacterium]